MATRTLKKLLEDRADLYAETEDFLNQTEGKGIALSKDEQYKVDGMLARLQELDNEIEPLQKQENKSKLNVMKNKTNSIDSDEEKDFLDFEIKKSVPVNRAMPATDFVLRNFDVDAEMQKVSVYSVIAGLTGAKKFPSGSAVNAAVEESKRSMTSTALLNPFLSAQLLDGGLSKSRLIQAGMKTFVMREGTHKFARIDTYPTFEWKAELASTTERDVVFSPVTFEAKTLRGWIQIGGETLQDALNIEQSLKQVFSKAIANGVDTAGLAGSGIGAEPLGIKNYVGIPTIPWNNTLDNYDAFTAGQKAVFDEDGPDLTATILSPDAWSQLARLKGTDEFQPVNPPFWMRDHKFLQTSKIQAVADETYAVMGGFESLNLGVRLNAEIMMTPVIAETYGYKMLAVFRGDFQPNRVEDFALITDISTAPALT